MDLLALIQSPLSYLWATVAGIVFHLALLRYGEWDLCAAKLIAAFVTVQLGLLGFLTTYAPSYTALPYTVLHVSTLGICFLVGTYSSILVYRGFFHRLRKFPGPFWARLSTFYATRLSYRSKLHLYEEVQALHRQYGDFVRLGRQTRRLIIPPLPTQKNDAEV
jgi:hypothetical protein